MAIIQTQVGTIKNVQVLYSEHDPLGVDLVINLPLSGMRLIFDSISQRLKVNSMFTKQSQLSSKRFFYYQTSVDRNIQHETRSFAILWSSLQLT